MPKYRVEVWVDIVGFVNIEAESAEQAEDMAHDWLADNAGLPLEGLDGSYREETSREYGANDAEEIKP